LPWQLLLQREDVPLAYVLRCKPKDELPLSLTDLLPYLKRRRRRRRRSEIRLPVAALA
jgi:hypothetical protein